MIRSPNNRYYVFTLMILLFVGVIFLDQVIPLLLWPFVVVVFLFSLIFRCPECDRPTMKVGDVIYCPPFPKKCFGCEFRYR